MKVKHLGCQGKILGF